MEFHGFENLVIWLWKVLEICLKGVYTNPTVPLPLSHLKLPLPLSRLKLPLPLSRLELPLPLLLETAVASLLLETAVASLAGNYILVSSLSSNRPRRVTISLYKYVLNSECQC